MKTRKKTKPNGYWDFENCKKEALKYKTRSEYQKLNKSSYNSALRNGWLDEICSHMKRPSQHNLKWTFDNCKKEALKYKTRSEYQKLSKSSYNSALKNGWLDEICSHMIKIGNKYKRCIYVFEFSDKSAYIGLTYNLEKRKYSHFNKKESAVYEHIKKTKIIPELKQLTDFISTEEAVLNEKYFLDLYKKNDWRILNKAKTGSLGSNNIIWNYEKCKEEALKYKTKKELYENSISAYDSMKRHKWLDELCSHMKRHKKISKF